METITVGLHFARLFLCDVIWPNFLLVLNCLSEEKKNDEAVYEDFDGAYLVFG